MSTYVFTDVAVGRPAITSHAAAGYQPAIQLGTIARAVDVATTAYGSGEFIYLKGLDSTVLGSWVTYNADDGSTTLLAADAIGPVAVAMSACVTGEYGWYQISGKAVGKALTGFLDNANVYGTATAGSVDDAVVAGDRVKNCKGASAVGTPSAGLAEFEIQRPWVDDALAA